MHVLYSIYKCINVLSKVIILKQQQQCNMEATCSFKKRVGGICSSDKSLCCLVKEIFLDTSVASE